MPRPHFPKPYHDHELQPALTVGQLIERLQKIDPAAEVWDESLAIVDDDEDVLISSVYDVGLYPQSGVPTPVRLFLLADGIPPDYPNDSESAE